MLLRGARLLIVRGRLFSDAVSTETTLLRKIWKDSRQIGRCKDLEGRDILKSKELAVHHAVCSISFW
jgi:hypothetical protein